jgi:hypothetical protein
MAASTSPGPTSVGSIITHSPGNHIHRIIHLNDHFRIGENQATPTAQATRRGGAISQNTDRFPFLGSPFCVQFFYVNIPPEGLTPVA